MGKVIETLLEKELGIVLTSRLFNGHKNALVFRARRGRDRLVIKIGLNPTAAKEIEENMLGYHEMFKLGIGGIAPPNLVMRRISSYPIIIMTDLGSTFNNAILKHSNPLGLFQILMRELQRIYEKTVTRGRRRGRSYHFLEEMVKCLRRQYFVHLLPAKLVTEKELELLEKLRIGDWEVGISCFGVWDFTPEDVFIKGEKLYYIDPPRRILGIPIIDIACFAGVAKDVYNLPSSDNGYKLLHSFAISNVANLLGLSETQAEKIFILGRSIQCSLSARFRINENSEIANSFARQSVKYLRLINT